MVPCVRSEAGVIFRLPELAHTPDAMAEVAPLSGRVPDEVELPVRPLRVTMGLAADAVDDALQVERSGTLGVSCTVMVLLLQGQGVL